MPPPLPSHRRRRLPLRTAIAAFALMLPARAAPEAHPPIALAESEIKAAAVYNIIGCVEWPATVFAADDSPLVIGILGRGPVADLIEPFIVNETWHSRPVIVRYLASVAEARQCHVVYIARSEHGRWRLLRSQLSPFPILTIGDAAQFAEQGGVVQLGIERNRLQITVNLEVARAAGLTISAKILRLARVIAPREP